MASRVERERERQRQERTRERIRSGTQRSMRRAISKAMRDMAKSYEESGELGIEAVFIEHKEKVKKILESAYIRSARSAQKLIMDSIGEKQIFDPDDNSTFAAAVRAFIASEGAKNIQNVSKTTKDQVQGIVGRMALEGIPAREIAAEIRKVSSRVSGRRAEVIARTEVGTSFSVAQEATMHDTEVSFKKEWAAAPDEGDARQTHQALDGEQVGANEMFNVNGAMMKYPRDPSGPPNEVINCRCAVLYIPQDLD